MTFGGGRDEIGSSAVVPVASSDSPCFHLSASPTAQLIELRLDPRIEIGAPLQLLLLELRLALLKRLLHLCGSLSRRLLIRLWRLFSRRSCPELPAVRPLD